MNASVFQSHYDSPPTSPNKLRSRTGRLAEKIAAERQDFLSTSQPLACPVSSDSPSTRGVLVKRKPVARTLPWTPSLENAPPEAGPQSYLMQLLSHPRLPLLLLFPVLLLLTYTLYIAVWGAVHAQHLRLEGPLSSIARVVEARAREAQWNSVAAVARIFAPPEPRPAGVLTALRAWFGFV